MKKVAMKDMGAFGVLAAGTFAVKRRASSFAFKGMKQKRLSMCDGRILHPPFNLLRSTSSKQINKEAMRTFYFPLYTAFTILFNCRLFRIYLTGGEDADFLQSL